MKIRILKLIAYALSVIGAYYTGYQYAEMRCGMNHYGFSAPPELALYVYGIPFGVAVLVCWALILLLKKKERKKGDGEE